MRKLFLVLGVLSSAGAAVSQTDCRTDVENRFDQIYHVNELREITNSIRRVIFPEEKIKLLELSEKFKTIPPDSEENMQELFRMQNESRTLVRVQTVRAGHPVLNSLPSPFDAVVKSVESNDGFVEYLVEVRGLLIQPDPLAHSTLWMQRWDPAHNPWRIVSVGVFSDWQFDYVSFLGTDDQRRILSKKEYLDELSTSLCH